MSEARGRSREDPMPKEWWSRGVTPHPRSGAAAKSARLRQPRSSREELPNLQGQGWQLGGATPPPKARGSGQEEQPHLQGAVAARVQEGLEELFHVQGQKGRW